MYGKTRTRSLRHRLASGDTGHSSLPLQTCVCRGSLCGVRPRRRFLLCPLVIASLAFLALATPGIVFAQATERDDIQAIAPLVGEGLSAVARIDIAGLDVEGLFRDVLDALPTQPLAAVRPHAIQVSRDLRAAGGRTVWCIANADDLGQAGGPLSQSPLPGQSDEAQARQGHDVPFLLAIPVLPPADVAKLAAALAPWMVTEQHGNLLLAGNARLIARARARRASPGRAGR